MYLTSPLISIISYAPLFPSIIWSKLVYSSKPIAFINSSNPSAMKLNPSCLSITMYFTLLVSSSLKVFYFL
jgi:hypothetical protein